MCAAEVPFFYLSGPLIRKIGPRNVVALSQIGYLVRFGYYSVRGGLCFLTHCCGTPCGRGRCRGESYGERSRQRRCALHAVDVTAATRTCSVASASLRTSTSHAITAHAVAPYDSAFDGHILRQLGDGLHPFDFLLRSAFHLKTQVLQNPWWVLPVEVVHGLTFAAMWAATTDFAHGVAPGAAMKPSAAVDACLGKTSESRVGGMFPLPMRNHPRGAILRFMGCHYCRDFHHSLPSTARSRA